VASAFANLGQAALLTLGLDKVTTYKMLNDRHSKIQDMDIDVIRPLNPSYANQLEVSETETANALETTYSHMSEIANLCHAFKVSPELTSLGLEFSNTVTNFASSAGF
jgi:hypothetical protein